MDSGDKAERRHFYRLKSSMIVLRTFLDDENDLRREGVVARTVSAGGVSFISQDSLPAGVVSELEIHLPDGARPVVVLGRIVRVEELDEDGAHAYEIGVQFMHLPDSDKGRLDRFCQDQENNGSLSED